MMNFPVKSDFALALYPKVTYTAVNWRGASLKAARIRAFCVNHYYNFSSRAPQSSALSLGLQSPFRNHLN